LANSVCVTRVTRAYHPCRAVMPCDQGCSAVKKRSQEEVGKLGIFNNDPPEPVWADSQDLRIFVGPCLHDRRAARQRRRISDKLTRTRANNARHSAVGTMADFDGARQDHKKIDAAVTLVEQNRPYGDALLAAKYLESP